MCFKNPAPSLEVFPTQSSRMAFRRCYLTLVSICVVLWIVCVFFLSLTGSSALIWPESWFLYAPFSDSELLVSGLCCCFHKGLGNITTQVLEHIIVLKHINSWMTLKIKSDSIYRPEFMLLPAEIKARHHSSPDIKTVQRHSDRFLKSWKMSLLCQVKHKKSARHWMPHFSNEKEGLFANCSPGYTHPPHVLRSIPKLVHTPNACFPLLWRNLGMVSPTPPPHTHTASESLCGK